MSQKDKAKIKASIVELKKKNTLYKAYCKSNKIKITGKINESIDSINQLCKLVSKLAKRKDFYQKLPEDYDGACDYVPSAILHIIESAEIAWEPIVRRCTDIKNVKRDASMFGCFPWTSKSYPWPVYLDENNKEVYATPGIQIDLESVKEFNKDSLGDGLLQVWFTDNIKFDTVLIPRSIINEEGPDATFYESKWPSFLGPGGGTEEEELRGWIVSDWKMIGVQTDDIDILPAFNDEWSRVDVDEFDFTYNTSKIINMIYDLLDQRHEYCTSLFGVPSVIQKTWQDFYNEGNRNLLSLNSDKNIQLLDDEVYAQLMYKKENHEVDFYFYWDCD
jgi:hypothetical protein